MTDLDALLAAVCDRPDDDTPRLIYADELDDAGEAARAEFVRIQCELAGTPTLAEWRYDEMRRRERELFTGWRRRWFDLPPGVSWSVVIDADGIDGLNDPNEGTATAVVRRGFVDEARCTLSAWRGGECGRCGGDGRAHGADRPFEWSADVDYGKCVVCSGSGRLPALGPAVLAAAPTVRVVTATDREPGQDGSGRWYWSWDNEFTHDWPSTLPDEIMRLGLAGRTEVARTFPSRPTALAALSAALIAEARAAAPGGR